MAEEMKPQEEGFSFRAERFFGKNWFLIALLSFVTVFYSLYVSEKTATTINELKAIVKNNNLYTVMTTTDGRAIKVVKQKVEPKFLEKWIAKSLVSNLIVSRAELTNNYQVNKFTSADDVYENSYKLRFIWTDVLNKNNVNAKKDFAGYLNNLKGMLGQDMLPEVITINNYSVEKFSFKSNTFDSEISVKVGTTNYNIAEDIHYEKVGVITIKAKGNLDLSKSTELNPYGLLLDSFTIELVTK